MHAEMDRTNARRRAREDERIRAMLGTITEIGLSIIACMLLLYVALQAAQGLCMLVRDVMAVL